MEISESDNMDDQNLIMEIMEIREELDDADLHRVLEIEKENKGSPASEFRYRVTVAEQSPEDAILRTVRQIEELVGRKDWESVKRVAIRLKYLQGIEMAIKNRSQNLT
jgi:molecular chaperone HscB